MITAKEFEAQFITEDGECSLPGTACVDVGDEIAEHKTVYNSNVYLYEDQYFQVTWSRSNSGYWSDSESYPPEVVEVEPHEVTRIVYLTKKV